MLTLHCMLLPLVQMQGMVLLHDAQLQQLPLHHAQQAGNFPAQQPGAAQLFQAGSGQQLEGDLQYQGHLHTAMGGG